MSELNKTFVCDSCHCEGEIEDAINIITQGEVFCFTCYMEWTEHYEMDIESGEAYA